MRESLSSDEVPLRISGLRVAPQRLAAAAMTPAQHYLLQARQMQALSFSVHIPLVCFGIAFPTLLLFVEWLYLRSGDPLYRTLARRWTKVMVALFAAGVVTGTILSFEMGLLWPAFTATFGSVFGLGFAVEGFSFFLEAIFIGIYVYGWNRLSPRLHFATGIPIVLAGFTGSLMVIAVNGWMNHPSGFRLGHGKAVDVHPFKALFENAYFWHELIHMYVAGYIVTGFLLAGAYAVRGCAAAGAATSRPRSRSRSPSQHWPRRCRCSSATGAAARSPRYQPTKLAALEGLPQTTTGAPIHVLGWYSDGRVEYGIGVPKLLSLLAYHRVEREGAGPRCGPGPRSSAGERRPVRVPDDGRNRNAAGAARRRLPRGPHPEAAVAALDLVLPCARARRARCRWSH